MSRDELIYKLIFSKEEEFTIYVSEYVLDIYKYSSFIKEIKSILKKSKVAVIKETVDILVNEVKWNLKVRK